jgi:hypothetical protein
MFFSPVPRTGLTRLLSSNTTTGQPILIISVPITVTDDAIQWSRRVGYSGQILQQAEQRSYADDRLWIKQAQLDRLCLPRVIAVDLQHWFIQNNLATACIHPFSVVIRYI